MEATETADDVVKDPGRLPTPADMLVALTEGHSAALLVGSLFAVAGIVVAFALALAV